MFVAMTISYANATNCRLNEFKKIHICFSVNNYKILYALKKLHLTSNSINLISRVLITLQHWQFPRSDEKTNKRRGYNRPLQALNRLTTNLIVHHVHLNAVLIHAQCLVKFKLE